MAELAAVLVAELAAVPPLQVLAERPLLAQPLQVLALQVLAERPLLAQPLQALARQALVLLALALLALALLAKDVVVRVQLLVPRPLLAQAPREAVVAQEAVERLTQSFSAAMAGILPSPGPPMYAPAPRSRRKPKRRPFPLT